MAYFLFCIERTTPGWWISNWYSPRDKRNKRIEHRVVRLMTNEKICTEVISGLGPIVGETFFFERVIVLCDRFFSYDPLMSLIEKQKRLPVGSRMDLAVKTRGGYFMHEALHWLDRDSKLPPPHDFEGRNEVLIHEFCSGGSGHRHWSGQAKGLWLGTLCGSRKKERRREAGPI